VWKIRKPKLRDIKWSDRITQLSRHPEAHSLFFDGVKSAETQKCTSFNRRKRRKRRKSAWTDLERSVGAHFVGEQLDQLFPASNPAAFVLFVAVC